MLTTTVTYNQGAAQSGLQIARSHPSTGALFGPSHEYCRAELLLFLCCCAVAEMNYDAATEDEPAGEVLLRGPQLFSGYYKQVGLHLIFVLLCTHVQAPKHMQAPKRSCCQQQVPVTGSPFVPVLTAGLQPCHQC